MYKKIILSHTLLEKSSLNVILKEYVVFPTLKRLRANNSTLNKKAMKSFHPSLFKDPILLKRIIIGILMTLKWN
jgi:hypothetical protein